MEYSLQQIPKLLNPKKFFLTYLQFKVFCLSDWSVPMKPDKELIGASTSLLVFGVLAREASYGYQIIRSINEEAEGLFTWQEGTIYPVLHKLEKAKLVRTQWQMAASRHRTKT
jgi:hypothetical protein